MHPLPMHSPKGKVGGNLGLTAIPGALQHWQRQRDSVGPLLSWGGGFSQAVKQGHSLTPGRTWDPFLCWREADIQVQYPQFLERPDRFVISSHPYLGSPRADNNGKLCQGHIVWGRGRSAELTQGALLIPDPAWIPLSVG